MRTLLVAINAKYIHSNLAIYTLRAYAANKGIKVDIAEYTINQQLEYMLKDIYLRKPDFIGFSCYIWNIEYVKKLARQVKKILPECHIWFGGPEVSYDASTVLEKNPWVEGIMLGEGEISFVKVIEALKLSKLDNVRSCLEAIGGIAIANPLVINYQGEYIDMDTLPFPYENFEDMAHRIIYYESSRGCPYNCSYCLSSVDKKVRYRSLELVEKELKIFIDNKVPQVKFVDRTFNCNRQRTKQLWKFLIDNDNGITNFHFEVSADIINDEEIELLSKMRTGLVQLEIGVQTTNPKTIESIRRKMDFDKLKQVVVRINSKENVHQHLDLIAGLPYEDYESFKKSFNDVYSLKPEQLQLGFLKVLKGSYMYEQASMHNIVYADYPPYEVLATPWLPYADVLRLKGIEEVVELYYNSGQFRCTMAYIERFFETPFDMFEYIADYYAKNKLFDIGHARIRRYEILREAMLAYDNTIKLEVEDFGSILDQALTFDLYHRENMKSRPSFAKDKDDYKTKLHNFYINEESLRGYLPDYDGYNTKQIERLTNVEIFDVNMIELLENRTIERESFVVLFDYKNISYVTNCARIVRIEL